MSAAELPDLMSTKDTNTAFDDSLDILWQAVLYNCNCHTHEEIIQQLMLAIDCTRDHGYELVWIVDHQGRADVYFGEKRACERVVRILRDIGLRAEVEST